VIHLAKNTKTKEPKKETRKFIKFVTFTVEGRFVTKQARDFWTEGNFAKALEILTIGMHGIDEPLALQILTGKKKIIGTCGNGKNTLDVIDDNATEQNGIPLSLLHQLEHGQRKVMESHQLSTEMPESSKRQNWNIRDCVPNSFSDDEAFDKEATGYLAKTEATIERLKVASDKLEAKTELMRDRSLVQEVLDLQKIMMISGKFVSNERALEAVKRQNGSLPRNEAIATHEPSSPSGYLSNDGTYYPCSCMGHTDLEEDLGSEDSLLAKGWIKISEMKLLTDNPPSERQIDFIVNLMEKWGVAELTCTKVADEKQLRDAIEGETRFSRFNGERKISTERDGD
jgi:hypothetical protein